MQVINGGSLAPLRRYSNIVWLPYYTYERNKLHWHFQSSRDHSLLDIYALKTGGIKRLKKARRERYRQFRNKAIIESVKNDEA